MFIWASAASAAAVILLLIIVSYRQQIRKICRQLDFLKENKTNLRLTSDLPLPEIDALIDEINEVLDRAREIRQDTRNSESRLKETITSLSHDIRTPLTSLDGYFQLLQQSASEEEQKKYIHIIQTRISSLKDMLEELFTYTRLQDGEYRMELEQIDLAKCVYDTVFSFYDDFQQRGIEPKADFCDGHLYITANEEAVRRTLQNLIRNALVHGKEKIVLELQRADGEAVFRCSNDTEHPEEIDMEQVFSRFYKADSARTHTSAGLGLSIARGLVERMGGRIRADLEGNTFSVEVVFRKFNMC